MKLSLSRGLLWVALLALLGTALPPAGPPSARADTPAGYGPGDALPGRLVVTLAEQPAAVGDLAAASGGEVAALGGPLYAVTVAPGTETQAARSLRALPGVRAVEPDRLRGWAAVPDDALYERQWSHLLVNAPDAWDETTGSRQVRVAIIDSGVRGDHPDLAANMVEQVDLSTGTPVARPLASDNDSCGIGHGTQVAGVLGAVGDNGVGVAGTAWRVGIVDLALASTRAAGSCQGASDSVILSALHYATFHNDNPVDIINLSVGGRQAYCPEAYEVAIDRARREGVVVVAAAGNSGPGTAQVPASCPGVISVAGVGPDGQPAAYSASNPWIDLAAPGGWDRADSAGLILTTSRRGDWTRVRGTSFAAAYVSGLAALLRARFPELTPSQIESVLERSANEDGERTPELGWGVVRADWAMSFTLRTEVVPFPVPDPEFPVLRLEPMPDGPGTLRLAAHAPVGDEELPTEPVSLAVAVSRRVFRQRGAVQAVLARDDDFADALAGSALGMGVGPLLFNPRGESLHPLVRKELRRALPRRSRIYVLGGEAGLGFGVSEELRGMGYSVLRLGGLTREHTAAAVADEIAQIRRRSGMPPVSEVIIATRADWPDAVGAGPLSARWASPVLLTDRNRLHPATREVLETLRPKGVVLAGSDGRVSDEVALRAQAAAGGAKLLRLAGASRHGTAAEVSREALARLGSVKLAVVVNLDHPQGYAHALSASVLAGAHGAVFLSVLEAEGSRLSDPAAGTLEQLLQARPGPADILGVLAGGQDVISPAVEQALRSRLERRG